MSCCQIELYLVVDRTSILVNVAQCQMIFTAEYLKGTFLPANKINIISFELLNLTRVNNKNDQTHKQKLTVQMKQVRNIHPLCIETESKPSF